MARRPPHPILLRAPPVQRESRRRFLRAAPTPSTPPHYGRPVPTLVHAARGSSAASLRMSAGPRRALENEEQGRLRHFGFPPALRDQGHATPRPKAVT